MTVSVQEIGSPGKGVLRFPYLMDELQDLRDAFQRGEREAFDAFYRQYAPELTRYLTKRLRSPVDAQDLVHETYQKAFRHHHSYEPSRAFKQWLFKIAKNVVIDTYRSNTVFQWARPLEGESATSFEDGVYTAPPSQTPVDPQGSPEDQLECQQNDQQLEDLTKTLSPRQRQAMHLRLVEELSYREIAKRLSVTPTSVKCLLFRARQTLLKYYAQSF